MCGTANASPAGIGGRTRGVMKPSPAGTRDPAAMRLPIRSGPRWESGRRPARRRPHRAVPPRPKASRAGSEDRGLAGAGARPILGMGAPISVMPRGSASRRAGATSHPSGSRAHEGRSEHRRWRLGPDKGWRMRGSGSRTAGGRWQRGTWEGFIHGCSAGPFYQLKIRDRLPSRSAVRAPRPLRPSDRGSPSLSDTNSSGRP